MKYQPFAYFAQNTSSQIDVFMLAEVFFTKNYSVRAGFAKLAYLAAQICIAEFSVVMQIMSKLSYVYIVVHDGLQPCSRMALTTSSTVRPSAISN